MLIAEDIQVEWDEGGCFLMVDGERWKIADPEQLYDRVKAAIGPWLREREDAERSFNRAYAAEEEAREVWTMPAEFRCNPDESGGYDISDPKHPDFHSVHADIWDNREKGA